MVLLVVLVALVVLVVSIGVVVVVGAVVVVVVMLVLVETTDYRQEANTERRRRDRGRDDVPSNPLEGVSLRHTSQNAVPLRMP